MPYYIQAAFDNIIPDAEQAQDWYVVLIEKCREYLGPWEGGTWGDRSTVISYRKYNSYEQATKVEQQITKLAQEMSDEANRNYGNHCLFQMDWLEERGLDSDYLPENDGPSEFVVIVTQTIPQDYQPSRTYE
jgi:hypothetical protein